LKKIPLLGMEIDNYTTSEALTKVETFFAEPRLDVVLTITREFLLHAKNNETVRRITGQISLGILGETEVLYALGIDSAERREEAEKRLFLQEFMKRIIRNHKRVFLLADTKEDLAVFRERLDEQYGRISILGSAALMEMSGDWDAVVNELNAQAPDVILSLIGSPVQEEFLTKNRKRIEARVWYGIGGLPFLTERKKRLGDRIRRRIRGALLKRYVKTQSNR